MALPERDQRVSPSIVQGRVTILIPSYIRPDDLRHTLAKTIEQEYDDIELIVVDDGTPGDQIKNAVQMFPSVTYVRTPKNLGLIGARNYGADRASGQFIVNLDDDSWLEDSCAVSRIVEFMAHSPECGILALNIGHKDIGYLWPATSRPAELRTYKGCGNVYRTAVLRQVGEYISDFFRQGEELDRSLRVMDAGYSVLSLPCVKVFHAQSPINRNVSRHLAYEAVNYLRRELIRCPFWLLPLGIVRASRWYWRHRSSIDSGLYASELFGSRVPLNTFVRKHRSPVKTTTYFRALRLPS